MEAAEFLARERAAVVEEAAAALGRSSARHYEAAGAAEVRARLEALYDHIGQAAETRDLGEMLTYARGLAAQRFDAGYDLGEIQTAFNALEEALWVRVFTGLEPAEYAETLGLVSTILGAAKDALAREYVALATHAHSPSLDLRSLFAGIEGA
jgi:hypothetical protein